ncbi:hypothetical protein BHE74_00018203 [Ensete ventricosum]|nr:hypothetical protein GW17_00015746 [Ensete ventricosum]RWW73882.1 hypothetical protein BHE74_00018203 [Ensete ventricosum]RZR97233.1 hypothetical protein BHM03_00026372 [Ensete ventricosum]
MSATADRRLKFVLDDRASRLSAWGPLTHQLTHRPIIKKQCGCPPQRTIGTRFVTSIRVETMRVLVTESTIPTVRCGIHVLLQSAASIYFRNLQLKHVRREDDACNFPSSSKHDR